MSTRIVDTNVIVRYLVADEPALATKAERLFAACERGEARLILLDAVIAETVFVLESFYEKPRVEIARVLTALVRLPFIETSAPGVVLDALARFGQSTLHFVDCFIAASAAARSVPVATFDRKLARSQRVEVRLD